MAAALHWVPEFEASPVLAQHLCRTQFSGTFAGDVELVVFGQGWDNRAFLALDRAGHEWVLRFP